MKLTLSAYGMVTAVGLDAVTSCAAIRAGISRAAPVTHSLLLDPDSQAMVPVIGHSVWGLTEGASAIARWLSMGRAAFRDLLAQLPNGSDASLWQRTGLMVIAPVLDDDRFVFFPQCHPEMIGETYVNPLLKALGVPLQPRNVYLLHEGCTGAVRAFSAAQDLLEREELDRMIILAADSYLDAHSLQWLGESERLKSADQPAGLMPGEAAVAVLIERGQMTVSGLSTKARVLAAVVDPETADYFDGQRRHGGALSRVLAEAVRSAQLAPPFSGDLIVDLNGEAWRAYEFGAALSRVPRDLLDGYRQCVPAMSMGDVGAASALAGVVIAANSFERKYAKADVAMIACMPPSGQAGALILDKASST